MVVVILISATFRFSTSHTTDEYTYEEVHPFSQEKYSNEWCLDKLLCEYTISAGVLASPQTSFGVGLSCIHFSPTDGCVQQTSGVEKWMRDKPTPKDVCGEATGVQKPTEALWGHLVISFLFFTFSFLFLTFCFLLRHFAFRLRFSFLFFTFPFSLLTFWFSLRYDTFRFFYFFTFPFLFLSLFYSYQEPMFLPIYFVLLFLQLMGSCFRRNPLP